jgi:uncharacterized RDD family membrane protein YckC
MAVRQRDTSLGSGVYFAPDDYVGIGRRIIIFLVDALVLATALFFLATLWSIVLGRFQGVLMVTALLLVWLYEVVLKRSDFRTVGYRLAGCRIVDLHGQRPSLFALTFRWLLWTFGPSVLLFDLMWSGIDDDRQTLRDRYAGTCLIKHSAVPIGTGEIHLAYYDTGSLNLMYPRVTHPKVSA